MKLINRGEGARPLARMSAMICFKFSMPSSVKAVTASSLPRSVTPAGELRLRFPPPTWRRCLSAERDNGADSRYASSAAAKRRGVKLGGPRLAAARKASIKVRSEAADAFAANVRPIIKEIQASGISSMRGIARALAARGVKTARGGDWSDVQVAAVLRR
jgi:hypothetical protein